jgi:carbon monoxide dehydrogenase subunit G
VELQHTFTVPAPVDQAWATLLDVEGIAPCFPGATLTGVDGDSFAGTVKVKLGPVSLQYAGKGRFLERDEAARRVVLEANGSDKRGNGTAGATVHARLEPAGEDRTTVVVDTDLKVTGRPAQFGRGVLQDVGGRIVEQFATCLAARMSADTAPSDAGSDAGSDTGSDAGPASGASSTAASPTAPGVRPDTASNGAVVLPAAPAPGPASRADEAPATGIGAPAPSPSSGSPSAGLVSPTPEAPAAELDLNAVVLPALARRYGGGLLAGLVALVVVRLLLRRRRR